MSQMTELGGALNWDKVDRLHKALRVGGVSVKQMAAELGVHRNTVGNYLRGTSEPDRRTLVTWALACGVPFAWLDEGASIESGPDGDGGVAITDAGRSPTVA